MGGGIPRKRECLVNTRVFVQLPQNNSIQWLQCRLVGYIFRSREARKPSYQLLNKKEFIMSASMVPTTITMHSGVSRFRSLYRLYDISTIVYSRYGTGDSEPDGVIQQAVWNTWNGKPHGLKSCGKYWGLYTRSYEPETLDLVAARLVDHALPIVHFLQSADRTPALDKAVFDFCWRFAR